MRGRELDLKIIAPKVEVSFLKWLDSFGVLRKLRLRGTDFRLTPLAEISKLQGLGVLELGDDNNPCWNLDQVDVVADLAQVEELRIYRMNDDRANALLKIGKMKNLRKLEIRKESPGRPIQFSISLTLATSRTCNLPTGDRTPGTCAPGAGARFPYL